MTKILVADDSVSVRDVVERALASREMEVLSASSGIEAIERIEREHPDLVVCDVLMPGRDGYEVCHFVKNHPDLRRTPVLLISGTVNPSVLEEAARVQSDDVLGKPFHMNELVRKVADLLRHNGEASSALAPSDPERSERPSSVRETLDRLAALSGVEWAALSDRDGLLVESTGGPGTQAELGAALAAWLAPALAGIGRELRRGVLHGVSIEYADGILTAHAVGGAGGGGMLAVFLRDPGAMAEVRYWVRKAVPELAHAAELSC